MPYNSRDAFQDNLSDDAASRYVASPTVHVVYSCIPSRQSIHEELSLVSTDDDRNGRHQNIQDMDDTP